MKRVLLVTLLIISMLFMVGFTSVEGSYWENAKEMYEWDAIEQVSEMEFNLSTPDETYEYKINMNGKSNLKDLSSYLEIDVEDLKDLESIPTIKMYTDGADIYINREAIISLLSAMGIEDSIEIEEEYVAIKSSQNDFDLNSNMLQDTIEFIDNMDLGIDLDMVQDGNTYTLTLESDELIDLLDAYLEYSIVNIDQLPNAMPEEVIITDTEKQEVLEGYNNFVKEYKDMAKLFITGSNYYQESTFNEDEFKQKVKLYIETPMGQLHMNSESVSSKLESYDAELPTSVMKITDEELTELMMGQMIGGEFGELAALVELDGSYIKLDTYNIEEGQILLKVEDGKAYVRSEEVYELLNIKLDNMEEYFHIRELDNYGFNVQWNEMARTIEIYK